MNNPRAKGEAQLDAREAAVLRSVIEQHVQSGEPVGSQTVARVGKLGISPASIRNTMVRLEERGLLTQPHTSAGRVPTDAGYRHYVDQTIGQRQQVEASAARSIDQALARSRGEIPELLGQASRQLSTVTHQVGLALAPELERIVVEKLEFVRLAAHRVMAIIVGGSGVVHQRILDIRDAPEQPELERIGRYLSGEFGGRTLPAMRLLLKKRMTEDRATYDRLQARSLAIGEQALDAELAESDLFVEGASNLFESPEFADLDIIRGLMKTLEEKATLIDLLSRLLDGDGVQVVIGAENPVSDLSRCSVVAANYRSGDRVVGTVAIVGPTRMEYPRVISLVEYLGKVLTRMFSAPSN